MTTTPIMAQFNIKVDPNQGPSIFRSIQAEDPFNAIEPPFDLSLGLIVLFLQVAVDRRLEQCAQGKLPIADLFNQGVGETDCVTLSHFS